MRVLSRSAPRSLKLLASAIFSLGFTATSVNALTIQDTFLSSITGSGNAAAIEAAIQTASNSIASLFSNPITVKILFGTSNSVGGGQSDTAVTTNSYSTYTTLLATNSTANPTNTVLSTAVANLSHGNDADGAKTVLSTTVNLRALGIPTLGQFDASGNFTGTPAANKFDGVILANPTYSTTISVFQHEIIEILGGGGQGSTVGDGSPFSNSYGGLDLYRYSAVNTPSYTTSSSATAYLSVDGGVTSIAAFNQSGGGSDYGDFTGPSNPSPSNTGPCLIQSAYICSGPDAFTSASPEYAMLESIGYDPIVATPLPAAWTMMLGTLIGSGLVGYRRAKRPSRHLIAAT